MFVNIQFTLYNRWGHFVDPAGTFSIGSQQYNKEIIAAIEANNDAYCLKMNRKIPAEAVLNGQWTYCLGHRKFPTYEYWWEKERQNDYG